MKSSILTLIYLSILLGAAGRGNYWQAWVYAALSLAINIATSRIQRGNPGLPGLF